MCELHPNHPIPVTEDCLGVANPAGSGAGGSKIAARGGGTGKSARLRRENAELAHSNNALEKQLRTLSPACDLSFTTSTEEFAQAWRNWATRFP